MDKPKTKIKKVECPNCSKGVEMCELRPCWGTPEDFEAIIKEGYAHMLMMDYYTFDGKDVYVLCGANNGHEGEKAGLLPFGPCAFLTDNKCEIHYIKPTGGAIACCKVKDQDGQQMNMEFAKLWDNDYGKALIQMWSKLVGYTAKPDIFDLMDMMDALIKKSGYGD